MSFELSDDAIHDIREFKNYLRTENGDRVANAYMVATYKKIETIATFPGIGRKRIDINKGVLSFTDVKYNRTIFYDFIDSNVRILRILSSYQGHLEYFK